MTTYADAAAAVRRARDARDSARDDLYRLQLQRVALGRALAREARGEGKGDPSVEAELRSLRAQLQAATARRASLTARLEKFASVDADIARLQERVDAAPARTAASIAEIRRLAAALEQARTAVERERLQAAVQAAQKQRATVADAAVKDRDALAGARARARKAADLREEARRIDERVGALQEEMRSVAERGRETDLRSEDAKNSAAIGAARRVSRERDARIRAAIDDLYEGRTPQELIGSWDDGLPILLLPLRIETRWQDAGRDGAALRVRVYPDDVSVTNHEPVLTLPEVEHGQGYWSAVRAAGADAAAAAAAWDSIARRFGGNRAAWVARQTRPLNWDAVVADTTLAMAFPDLPTKPSAWTTAQHSRVLPDRFVLLAWRDGKIRVSQVGRPIDDIVVLGPSPVEGEVDGEASVSREEGDRSLKFGAAFDWVRDFDRAVDCGMAFRVAVPAEDASGFDRLLVLGLKLSADAPDAQALVEGLIDNHHYSRGGFELLRQGTPTNNTDSAGSGYQRGVETGVAATSPPQFDPRDDRASATDGQRFADFLGIAYDPLRHADGAGYADHAEAVAMNRALYAGTLGYYLDHMLNEVVDEHALGTLRRHFTDLVTGRGPIAAFRVGSQPYGVLPTSSMGRWQPTATRRGVDGPAVRRGDPFEASLVHVLRAFDQAWTTLVPDVRRLGRGAESSADLLAVLGLHPTSVEFHQRVGYSFDYFRNLESFVWTSDSYNAALKMVIEAMGARTVLRQLGYAPQRPDGQAKPEPLLLQLVWRAYQTPLDAGRLVDDQPYSETNPIEPYNAAGSNYLDWLLANAANPAALEAQNFGGAPRPGAVLYMVLHFSLVMEGSRAIHRFLGAHEINADEMVRSRKFLNVGSASPSVWEVFRAPANRVVPAVTSAQPLFELMHAPQLAGGAGQFVKEQRAALEVLRALPTARLERALVEHIDTLSYRLDAWQTSLFSRRLHQQRRLEAPVAARRTGVYLGAYGYLEDVRPAARGRDKIPERLLPAALRRGTDDLYTETGNGGYVHAPSLNHATAAALLRNGYLTHASPGDPNALAVNLSSGRVQRAKQLLDGIKHGQTLETLLGVQFERGLHDWTTRPVDPVILDDLKPLFRARFPIVRTQVPQADAAAAGGAIHEDFHVVNGLTLARTTAAFPYGIAELSALTPRQQEAIRAEKAAIENTLDSLRDVLTAESAYQLALGNFERAAAVLQSAGSGTLPPDVEVLDTPRATGIAFTQRLAVQFDTTLAADPWGAPPSARAQLEPALNAWLGDLLGPPDTITCVVAAVDAAGAVLTSGGVPIEGAVSAADLELQPVDFVYLIRSQPEPSGAAELETRIRYKFARDRALPDDTIVRITFADAGSRPDARSFAEVLPLADRLRKLLGTARPLDARHFHSASKDLPAGLDNPGRIDTAELRGRVTARLAAIRAALPTLAAATVAARTSTAALDIDALRAALVRVARDGVAYAMPRSAVGSAPEQRDALVAQADALLARTAALETATDAQLTTAATASNAEQVVSVLGTAVKAWMGRDMVLLPRFVFGDASAVGQAYAARDALLAHVRGTVGVPLPVEEWLHGAACVRALVHDFEMMRVMADAIRADPLVLSPLQLPFREGDTWLGAEYPPALEVLHDTLSIVQHLPQGFTEAGPQCGLLIDEWTESVPSRDAVTGLCFNFNAPNSAPPQALLLAVTPHETGSWTWDDLVDSVLDTFRRARLRAVEPDAIGGLSGIGTLLPALVAEFSTSAASVSLDYSMAVSEIRIPVLAMAVSNEG